MQAAQKGGCKVFVTISINNCLFDKNHINTIFYTEEINLDES